MPFSPALSDWLSAHSSFVNDVFEEDLQGGRSLGPASGALWDAYPFLHACPYSGLFAGMSLAGVSSRDIDVFLLEYSSGYGFTPTLDGPFTGSQWQEWSGDQWRQINPSVSTGWNLPFPTHPVDMILSIGDNIINTRTWRYKGVPVSNKYVQHSWVGEGYCLIAVTFADRPEWSAPFLRPRFVTGKSSRIDPYCLYTYSHSSRLFTGRVLIVPSGQVDVSVQDNTIIFTREVDEETQQIVQKISGVGPNAVGNVACTGRGCHRFFQNYEEYDPAERTVKLEEGQVAVQNACAPCCHCEEYIDLYEQLRKLYDTYRELIDRFSNIYTQSMETRDKLEEVLRKRAKLIQVHLGEWGEDSSGFYCTVLVTIAATETIKPSETVKIRFYKNDAPIGVASAILPAKLEALSLNVTIYNSGEGVQLSGIFANYMGAKIVRLRVRFQEEFTLATFDPSKINIIYGDD